MPGNSGSPLIMEVERRGADVVIRPRGRLTEIEADRLAQELDAALKQGARRLVLHLRDVPFLTSSCLGAFMGAHKKGREQGSTVVLAEMQPLVREVVATTKLTKLFAVFDTLEEALAESREEGQPKGGGDNGPPPPRPQ